MEKLTTEQYIRLARRRIPETAQKIINETIDICDGCQLMLSDWNWADLEENALYDALRFVDDDILRLPDHDEYYKDASGNIIPLEIRKSQYVYKYKEDVKDLCKKILSYYKVNSILREDQYRTFIRNTAQKMLKGEIDPIEGVRLILANWEKAEFGNDDLYYVLLGIDAETKSFPKGNERQNGDSEALKKRDTEEAAYLKKNRQVIEDMCQDLINYCEQNIIKIPE